MEKFMQVVYWATRLIAALILAQTLFFKFTGAAESVYIFTTIGMEPWGRIGVGIMELLAAGLLLVNVTAWLGGVLAFGLMLGAIGMHLTILGISVQHDGGYLFLLAVIVTICSGFVIWKNKENILMYLNKVRTAFSKSELEARN